MHLRALAPKRARYQHIPAGPVGAVCGGGDHRIVGHRGKGDRWCGVDVASVAIVSLSLAISVWSTSTSPAGWGFVTPATDSGAAVTIRSAR